MKASIKTQNNEKKGTLEKSDRATISAGGKKEKVSMQATLHSSPGKLEFHPWERNIRIILIYDNSKIKKISKEKQRRGQDSVRFLIIYIDLIYTMGGKKVN